MKYDELLEGYRRGYRKMSEYQLALYLAATTLEFKIWETTQGGNADFNLCNPSSLYCHEQALLSLIIKETREPNFLISLWLADWLRHWGLME
jgi:hypothetical protein